MKPVPPELLYVVGITPRSGTNFLYRLIGDHPFCLPVAGGEDYFLLKSDLLHLFAESVYSKWNADWGYKQNNSYEHILSALGDGLIRFLEAQSASE